jgi:hypothetical protein
MKKGGKLALGQVKETEGQEKWHVSSLSAAEIEATLQAVKAIPLLAVQVNREHIELQERTANREDILRVLAGAKKENLVEVNVTRCEVRVLLRDTVAQPVVFSGDNFESPANLCFVVTLGGKVVTAYWNKVGDDHKTLHNDRYNGRMAVTNVLKMRTLGLLK